MFTLPVRADGGATRVLFNGLPSGGATSCTQLLPVSNSPFITVGQVGGTGGRGTLCLFFADITVAVNPAATSRSGTVTFNDATLIVNQERDQIAVTTSLFDPARTPDATTQCYVRGPASQPTTCLIKATVNNDGPAIVSYDWSVWINSGNAQRFDQTGLSPQIWITYACGQPGSTVDGITYPLIVELTLRDSLGNTVRAPESFFQARLFTCGS